MVQIHRKKIMLVLLIGYASFIVSVVQAETSVVNLQASYDYLLAQQDKGGGALYMGTAGKLNGYKLPLSYYDTADYWGKYVCTISNNHCTVTDTYHSNDYTLTPDKGPAGDLQTERTNVHNGSDIYDAATWQIAVVLGNVENHFSCSSCSTRQDNYTLANDENILLREGYDGNASHVASNVNRGITNGDVFVYNGHPISNPYNAYFFRMVARNWLSRDPFMGTSFASYITAKNLPKNNPEYRAGKISWTDWKPITGENAWAFLIGPLQAAYIHYVKGVGKTYVPFSDQSVQNALAVLPTFAAMQSPIGAVYYVPSGTLGNQGDKPVNPHQVSVENNFSLYGGLNILKATLQAELKNETDLTPVDQSKIKAALESIDTMIHGGQVANNTPTKGLLAFFKNNAWRDGEFIQGGLANDLNQSLDWVPTLEPKAVDVNTWGVAALGPKQIEDWFGFGAAYKVWQQVKNWAGYGDGQTLWGVGYSDKDGNGLDSHRKYQQGILSAEWTAGAINMVRVMIAYYQTVPSSSSNYQMAKKYIKSLISDENSMLTNIQNLRIDKYKLVNFPGKPANYDSLLSSENYLPYLYASKRYMIPFGWYANPLPSTCSTAWMIMVADRFNPFVYGGGVQF